MWNKGGCISVSKNAVMPQQKLYCKGNRPIYNKGLYNAQALLIGKLDLLTDNIYKIEQF